MRRLFAPLAARLLLASLAGIAAATASARVVEEQIELPVQVVDGYGKAIARPIVITVFRDDAAAAPQPAIVINHGRAAEAAERAAFGRARYGDISRWFVRQGFVVALPTRIGYGVTGGEDVEDSGPCGSKRFGPGFAAAATQIRAAVGELRQRPEVQPDRIVVLGQSYGGAAAVALAAQNPAGVVAAISFAGGSGGNPDQRPFNPCSPQQVERAFAAFGAQAKVPMLWVYTENDRYWGASIPAAWAEAFRAAGGNLRLVWMPPAGDDGHMLFTRHAAAWQPVVAEFLRAQGFALDDAAKGKP